MRESTSLMHRFLFISALSLMAACDNPASPSGQDAGLPPKPTELVVNVEVSPSFLAVFIREAERDCECSLGEWPELGSCASLGDFVSCTCDPYPGSCVRRLALERPGKEDVEGSYLPPQRGFVSLGFEEFGEGASLLIQGCGGQARVPIAFPSAPMPRVHVTTLPDEFIVDWESDTPASFARVLRGDGEFDIRYCHDVSGRVRSAFDPRKSWAGYVQTFGEPIVHETELGTVSLWASERILFDVLPPELAR